MGLKEPKRWHIRRECLTKRLIKIKRVKLKNQISLKQKEALISTQRIHQKQEKRQDITSYDALWLGSEAFVLKATSGRPANLSSMIIVVQTETQSLRSKESIGKHTEMNSFSEAQQQTNTASESVTEIRELQCADMTIYRRNLLTLHDISAKL